MTGKCLLVAPEIVVSDLARVLALGSRTGSGMQYRAYAVDRSDNSEISRALCRRLVPLCKKPALLEAARHRVSNRDSSQVATRAIEAALPVNRSGSHIERLRRTFITAVIWPAPAKSRIQRKRLTSARFPNVNRI